MRARAARSWGEQVMLDEALIAESREQCAGRQGWSVDRWTGKARELAAHAATERGRYRASAMLRAAAAEVAEYQIGGTLSEEHADAIGMAAELLSSFDVQSEYQLLCDASRLALEGDCGE